MKNLLHYLGKIEEHSNTIYRGHANIGWEVKPSIGRHHKGDWSEVLMWEKESLQDFKKRSLPYLKAQPSSDIEWLCLMQHHGCSTRLIDFTTNPLIALFFASDPTIDSDGALVVARYSRRHEEVSNENLFQGSNNFAYYPPHITERIIGQSGCFVCPSTPNKVLSGKQIEIIEISKITKIGIRYDLNHLGINHSTLFPGLDGVCLDLNQKLISHLEFAEFI